MDVPQHDLSGNGFANRRQWLRQISNLAMAVSPLAALAQTDKTRVQLVVDDVSSLSHLPVMLAHHLGYFKSEGLLVDVVEQSWNHSDAHLSSGLIAWSVPFEQVLRANQKEAEWVAVMQTGRTPQLALGINKKTMPVLKGLKDLEHKKIGVQELDSFSQRCTDYMLLQTGISLSRISYIAVGQSLAAIQMLRNGSIDAICFGDPLISLLDRKGEVGVVRNLRSIRETVRVFSGLLPGHSLCVPYPMATKSPQICQALVNGVMRAVKWLRTAGPSDFLHNMTDPAFMSDRAIYLHAVENMRDSFTVDGMLTSDSLSSVLRLQRALNANTSIKRNLSQSSYTNEFVLQAKKQLKI